MCVYFALSNKECFVVTDCHDEHPLILVHREALFRCDACGEKATDSSYKYAASLNFGSTKDVPFHH